MHKEVLCYAQQTKNTTKRMGKPLDSNNVYLFLHFYSDIIFSKKKIPFIEKSCKQKNI